MISLIAAMDQNRLIGNQNRLPWNLPDDLKHFHNITRNKPIIMGRKTHESIGRVLSKRRNIILTRQQNYSVEGCEIVASLQDALDLTKTDEETMIIGGATIYEQALPLADRMYLTIIDQCFEGDAYFPEWKTTEWQLTQQSHHIDDTQSLHYRFTQHDRY